MTMTSPNRHCFRHGHVGWKKNLKRGERRGETKGDFVFSSIFGGSIVDAFMEKDSITQKRAGNFGLSL